MDFMLTSRDRIDDDNKVIREQNFCRNTVISANLCRLVTKLLTGVKKTKNKTIKDVFQEIRENGNLCATFTKSST